MLEEFVARTADMDRETLIRATSEEYHRVYDTLESANQPELADYGHLLRRLLAMLEDDEVPEVSRRESVPFLTVAERLVQSGEMLPDVAQTLHKRRLEK